MIHLYVMRMLVHSCLAGGANTSKRISSALESGVSVESIDSTVKTATPKAAATNEDSNPKGAKRAKQPTGAARQEKEQASASRPKRHPPPDEGEPAEPKQAAKKKRDDNKQDARQSTTASAPKTKAPPPAPKGGQPPGKTPKAPAQPPAPKAKSAPKQNLTTERTHEWELHGGTWWTLDNGTWRVGTAEELQDLIDVRYNLPAQAEAKASPAAPKAIPAPKANAALPKAKASAPAPGEAGSAATPSELANAALNRKPTSELPADKRASAKDDKTWEEQYTEEDATKELTEEEARRRHNHYNTFLRSLKSTYSEN